MKQQRAEINRFLVEVFNEILKDEEDCLSVEKFQNLSVRELHVIEAVCQAVQSGQNQSANIAKSLRITAGSLTTAVTQLEKKGYLCRTRDRYDKRVVRITATRLGQEANGLHDAYHCWLVDAVVSCLNEEEQTILVRALGNVDAFFRTRPQTNKEVSL